MAFRSTRLRTQWRARHPGVVGSLLRKGVDQMGLANARRATCSNSGFTSACGVAPPKHPATHSTAERAEAFSGVVTHRGRCTFSPPESGPESGQSQVVIVAGCDCTHSTSEPHSRCCSWR
jgi:hypothetical protein